MRLIIFILTILIISTPSFADTIYLKDGGVIKDVSIISIDDGDLVIIRFGKEKRVPLEVVKEFRITNKAHFKSLNSSIKVKQSHKFLGLTFLILGIVEWLNYDDINRNPHVLESYKNRSFVTALVTSAAGIYYLYK